MLSSERADHSWSFASSTSGGRDGFSFSDILTGYGRRLARRVVWRGTWGDASDGRARDHAELMRRRNRGTNCMHTSLLPPYEIVLSGEICRAGATRAM